MKSIVKKVILVISVVSAVNPAFATAGWRDSLTSFVQTFEKNRHTVTASLSAMVVYFTGWNTLRKRAAKHFAELRKARQEKAEAEQNDVRAKREKEMPDLEDAPEEYLRTRDFVEKVSEERAKRLKTHRNKMLLYLRTDDPYGNVGQDAAQKEAFTLKVMGLDFCRKGYWENANFPLLAHVRNDLWKQEKKDRPELGALAQQDAENREKYEPREMRNNKNVTFCADAKTDDSTPGAYAKRLREELAKRKEELKKRKKNHQPSQLVALT